MREIIPDLERMVAAHPLDEQVHGQLMVALYRAGRQADALAVYRRLRQTLGEELGIDPSQPLRDLETAILRQDPALDAPAPAAGPPGSPPAAPEEVSHLAAPGTAGLLSLLAAAPAPPVVPVPVPVPVPAQLPAAVAAFAGRGAELADLDALLPDAGRRRRGAAGCGGDFGGVGDGGGGQDGAGGAVGAPGGGVVPGRAAVCESARV